MYFNIVELFSRVVKIRDLQDLDDVFRFKNTLKNTWAQTTVAHLYQSCSTASLCEMTWSRCAGTFTLWYINEVSPAIIGALAWQTPDSRRNDMVQYTKLFVVKRIVMALYCTCVYQTVGADHIVYSTVRVQSSGRNTGKICKASWTTPGAQIQQRVRPQLYQNTGPGCAAKSNRYFSLCTVSQNHNRSSCKINRRNRLMRNTW